VEEDDVRHHALSLYGRRWGGSRSGEAFPRKHEFQLDRKSYRFRAAEDHVAELEAEVAAYPDQADRAEQWLHKVYTEIEDPFLRQEKRRNGTR
jgi:hypothetical protein